MTEEEAAALAGVSQAYRESVSREVKLQTEIALLRAELAEMTAERDAAIDAIRARDRAAKRYVIAGRTSA